MKRFVSILLCICLLVVCALTAWFGHRQLQSHESGTVQLEQYPCSQLLDQIPSGLPEFEITDFYPGKQFVAIDRDDDKQWERVYVPVFEKPLSEIRSNYRALVLCFADVRNSKELKQRLRHEAIKAQYWPYSQRFDFYTYNALAKRYSSLNFDRSLIIHCGFAKSTGMAKYLYWGGAAGALLALLGAGWQSLSLVLIAIRKSAAVEKAEEEEEEEETEFLNRAGLPTIKRD